MTKWTRRALRLGFWALLVPALAVLVVRAFVGDVYYVDSRSMEPVLHGSADDGEYVFVVFEDHPRLERFDVVVLTRPNEPDPVVKRVVGLPGETLQIASGDLYIDGKPLAAALPRPPWVPVFDSACHDFAQLFLFDRQRWTKSDATWHVDARGARNVLARLRTRLLDDYLGPDGARVEGKRYANDAALELELALTEPWDRFTIQLTEEGDVFALELVHGLGSKVQVRLLRSADERNSWEVLEHAEVDLTPPARRRWRLVNVDNRLAIELDGRRLLERLYAANTPPTRGDGGYQHALPRIEIGGDNFVADLRDVRIWRDVTYYDLGRHATRTPEVLAPSSIFVIGDNSGESVDSREWGPVPLASVIGRPFAVVWPPSRWRRL